ncbi:hypothetical protein GCM10027447_36030 [Glycomyces halotolerans]
MELIEELLELERAGWDALCDGTGSEFYGTVMAADGIMVLAHGFALDREAVVESLREAPTWDGYEISQERTVQVGDDAAGLIYTARAWREGDEDDFRALMSSVYFRADGIWNLALYQQTPVPQG